MYEADIRAGPAVNFFLMYGLSMWVGSVALRVQMRLQLRLFQLEQRHAESARTDVLTGLMNRRSLEELAALRLRESRRLGQPLSVLLMDLDHFKAINDRYGHDVGDRALRHGARCFSSALRGADLLGRWGGEEFLAILVDTRIDDACKAAQRCIDCLATADLPVDGSDPLNMGVSIGVAEWQADESLDALLRRADAALYRAKQSGRGVFNRAEQPDR